MTPHIRSILVPVDFSEHSREAVRHALWLADRSGASIDLLHVWQPPWHLSADAVSMMAGTVIPSPELFDLERAERDLQAWRDHYGSSAVPVGTRLEQGAIAETVLRVAEEEGYDMVVMGTHGRTGLARLVLGSVAQQVSARAACPVLTVHAPEQAEQPSAQ